MFIELTMVFGKAIMVNVSQIRDICSINQESTTVSYAGIDDNTFIQVSQTYEEIKLLIQKVGLKVIK